MNKKSITVALAVALAAGAPVHTLVQCLVFHMLLLPIMFSCWLGATVVSFAKKTGDYRSLSVTDLRVMALTYMLEVERNGTANIRAAPRMPKPSQPARASLADTLAAQVQTCSSLESR